MKTNNMKITKIVFVFVLLICAFMSINTVDAASLSISATATTVTVGGSATITVKGNDAIGRVNVSSSNSNIVSVIQSSMWIEGSASFKVTAKTVGTATITITPVDMASSSGETVSLGSKSITIYSKAPYVDTRSKNNNLQSLTIEGYELAFDTNNTAYNLDIDFSVDTLNINAVPQDAKSSVRIEGNTGIGPGETIVKVIVTAENKTEKVYEIKVNKPKNPDDVNANLKTLNISNAKLRDAFSKDVFEYMVEDLTADINSLVLNYETEVEGTRVEITGNEKLEQGLNRVIIKVFSKDESVTKEYSIIAYKTNEVNALTEVKELTTQEKITNWILENKLVVLCLSVILILIIVIIILLVRNAKFRKSTYLEAADVEEVEPKKHRRNAKVEEEPTGIFEEIKKEKESSEEEIVEEKEESQEIQETTEEIVEDVEKEAVEENQDDEYMPKNKSNTQGEVDEEVLKLFSKNTDTEEKILNENEIDVEDEE